MQLFMDIVFVIMIVFFSYQYIWSLARMRKRVIFPVTDEEMAALRKYPQKPLDFPANPKRKAGIIAYSFLLLFIIAFFTFGKITESVDWSFYPLLLFPLINGDNLLNVFAIQDGGIIAGGRFVHWSRIKNYQFVPIDLNHKFYGYSPEVNDGFELIIKTKGFTVSCIVTSSEMKEKLSALLNEHIKQS